MGARPWLPRYTLRGEVVARGSSYRHGGTRRVSMSGHGQRQPRGEVAVGGPVGAALHGRSLATPLSVAALMIACIAGGCQSSTGDSAVTPDDQVVPVGSPAQATATTADESTPMPTDSAMPVESPPGQSATPVGTTTGPASAATVTPPTYGGPGSATGCPPGGRPCPSGLTCCLIATGGAPQKMPDGTFQGVHRHRCQPAPCPRPAYLPSSPPQPR